MPKKKPTKIDPVVLLEMLTAKPSSVQQVADDIGVTAPYIAQILQRKRGCSQRVLDYLQIEKVVTIEYRWLER